MNILKGFGIDKVFIYLIGMSVPFSSVLSFELFGATVRIFDLLLIAFIIYYLASKLVLGRNVMVYKGIFLLFVLLFINEFIFSLISIVIIPGQLHLQARNVLWALFYGLGFCLISDFFLLRSFRFCIDYLIFFLKWFLVVSVVAFAGYLLVLFFPHEMSFLRGLFCGNQYFGVLRFKGLAAEPAYWGRILFFPLITYWLLYVECPNLRGLRHLWAFLAIVSTISYFFTVSTFSYVIIGIMLIAILVRYSFWGLCFKHGLIFGFIFLLLAFFLGTNGMLGGFIEKIFDVNSTASASERNLWRIMAWDMFLKSPIWGNGVGSFASLFEYGHLMPNVRPSNDANSFWMLLLAERGLIGFLGMVVPLVYFWIRALAIGSFRMGQEAQTVRFAICLYMLCFFLNLAITGVIWLYYVWFFCLLSVVLLHKSQNGRSSPKLCVKFLS